MSMLVDFNILRLNDFYLSAIIHLFLRGIGFKNARFEIFERLRTVQEPSRYGAQ
jgi:hypothetical protein